MVSNLTSRLSEWSDDLGEEGWKTTEKEEILGVAGLGAYVSSIHSKAAGYIQISRRLF